MEEKGLWREKGLNGSHSTEASQAGLERKTLSGRVPTNEENLSPRKKTAGKKKTQTRRELNRWYMQTWVSHRGETFPTCEPLRKRKNTKQRKKTGIAERLGGEEMPGLGWPCGMELQYPAVCEKTRRTRSSAFTEVLVGKKRVWRN